MATRVRFDSALNPEWSNYVKSLVESNRFPTTYGNMCKNFNVQGDLHVYIESSNVWQAGGAVFANACTGTLYIHMVNNGNISSLVNLFQGFTGKKAIFLNKDGVPTDNWCNGSNIAGCFEYAGNLVEVPNITTGYIAAWTFDGCGSLTEIPSRIAVNNTLKVLSIQQAFANCRSLTKIEPVLDFTDFAELTTNNVKWAFAGCNKLTSIKLKGIHSNLALESNPMGDIYPCFELSNLDEESIIYLLDNLVDLTGSDRKEIVLPSRLYHNTSDQIDQAIQGAQGKNWRVWYANTPA